MAFKIKEMLFDGVMLYGLGAVLIWLFNLIMKVDVSLFNIVAAFQANMIMAIVGLLIVVFGSAFVYNFVKEKFI